MCDNDAIYILYSTAVVYIHTASSSERVEEITHDNKSPVMPSTPANKQIQADALAAEGIEADSFLLLNVPDEMLVQRVVGRRLDPETGDIYHLDFSPPPADIIDRYHITSHHITSTSHQIT